MGNRERLIRSAAEIFNRQGYAATSVEDLLADTGVARSNFYYHFDSKLDLARELMERWTSEYHEAVSESWDGADSTAEKRRLLFRLLERDAAEPEGLLDCPLGVLALELAPHDPEIEATLTRFLRRLRERLESLTPEEGAPGGDADDPGDPVADVSAAALVGAMTMCHALRDPAALGRAERGLARLLGDVPSGGGSGAPPEPSRAARDRGPRSPVSAPCAS